MGNNELMINLDVCGVSLVVHLFSSDMIPFHTIGTGFFFYTFKQFSKLSGSRCLDILVPTFKSVLNYSQTILLERLSVCATYLPFHMVFQKCLFLQCIVYICN
jgi:hypothetical protein